MHDGDPLKLALAMSAPRDQPEAAFSALCELARAVVGHKLFTLMVFDEKTQEAQRIFSSMPDAYPVSGKKPANESRWSGIVIDEGRTFVANTIEEIAEVFPDHELIESLGCRSVINIPVVVAGRFLGTINCLEDARHYTPQRVASSEALKLPGAACFLLQHSIETGGL